MISIIVPVYNEEKTLKQVLCGLDSLELQEKKEVIILNDGSTDSSLSIIKCEIPKLSSTKYYSFENNRGKGAMIAEGIKFCEGDIIFIRDADLEYSLQDIPYITSLVRKNVADVVYGSRFLINNPTHYSAYALGNKILSWITSILYGKKVTDMETCYKCFRKSLVDWSKLREKRFGIEPELTSKLLKQKVSFMEVPILYKPRTKEEGKKIRAIDGLRALWVLVRGRFS